MICLGVFLVYLLLFFLFRSLVIKCYGVFFGNEMLMIYFSSFDVSFVFFYPSGRNLSDSNFYLFIDQSEN